MAPELSVGDAMQMLSESLSGSRPAARRRPPRPTDAPPRPVVWSKCDECGIRGPLMTTTAHPKTGKRGTWCHLCVPGRMIDQANAKANRGKDPTPCPPPIVPYAASDPRLF